MKAQVKRIVVRLSEKVSNIRKCKRQFYCREKTHHREQYFAYREVYLPQNDLWNQYWHQEITRRRRHMTVADTTAASKCRYPSSCA